MIAVTCMSGRPGVSRLFALHMKDIGLRWVAAVTPDDPNISICEEFGAEYVEIGDENLAIKWTAAVCLASALHPEERVMVLGSDDLVAREWVDLMESDDRDLVLPSSLAFYNLLDGKALLMRDTDGRKIRFGAGRVMSPRAARLCRWKQEKNNGLDYNNYMMFRLHKIYPEEQEFHRPPLTDMKGVNNLWSFESRARLSEYISADDALWMCSPETKDQICHISTLVSTLA